MENKLKTVAELQTLKLADQIRYITNTHHKAEEKLIQEIDQYMRILMKVHYDTHGAELAVIYRKFLEFHGVLAEHFAKEEREHFIRVREGQNYPRELLLAEHAELLALTAELSQLTDDYTPPADGCETYQATFAMLERLAEDVKLNQELEETLLYAG